MEPARADGRADAVERREAATGNGQPWRFTTYNVWGENTLKANTAMYVSWQDVRGYESIIPRQYVAVMNRLRLGSNELPFARVGPFYGGVDGGSFSALDTPLLDLLNVKYILSTQRLPNGRFREVYRDPHVGVYENTDVLPRAFVASRATDRPLQETADLRQTVFLEEPPAASNQSEVTAQARIVRYAANEVVVQTQQDGPGWLVLTDAYAPGWRATTAGSQELRVYRADGAFRAVYLPSSGAWTVRFSYEPASFQLGLLVSAASLAAVAVVALRSRRSSRRSRPSETARA